MHRQHWISILLKGETSACTQLKRIQSQELRLIGCVDIKKKSDRRGRKWLPDPSLDCTVATKLIPLFNVGDNWKKGHNQSHATLRPELIPMKCNKTPNAYRGEIVVILYLKHREILQCSTSGHVLRLWHIISTTDFVKSSKEIPTLHL